MTDSGHTQAERIADLEALIEELREKIEGLDARIAELEQEISTLRGDVRDLEADAGDRAQTRLGAYRSLLIDLDHLFGIRHLPFGVRAALDDFGELLT
jgi:chromosome segregation ATPase